MDLESRKETRLTNSQADDLWPVWSPDGEKVAFISDRDGNRELYMMSADGSGQLRLTYTEGYEEDPDWSPDGKSIVYTSLRDATEDIFTIDTESFDERRLTQSRAMDSIPVWSPEGDRILFVSNRDHNPEIYLMNSDGSDPKRLTHHPGSDGMDSHLWSPMIAGGSCGSEYRPPMYPKTGHKSPDPAQPLARPEDCFGPTIAFVSERDKNREIYLMNEDGSHQRNLTQNTWMDDGPAWSPDGSKLTFISNRGGNTEIYLLDLLTEPPRVGRLTEALGSDLWPVWSPDGSRIAFLSERDGNSEVYLMNQDGTHQQRVTNTQADEKWVAWRPE